jgi:molybdate transport system ATP-binding protein
MIELFFAKRLFDAGGGMNLRVDLTIEKGQLVTLYGASGAGKTSILRMLAGLMTPDKGRLLVNGVTWFNSEKKIHTKPQHRNIGIVFQDYALFPNMTVRENITYALDKNQPKSVVDELLQFMELTNLHRQRPQLLSGGQKQRVALARALARKPEILLLDEPLSALDTELRLKMQDYILNTHKAFGLTTILVSHDILEVVRLSDKVYVIENGIIAKQGLPREVLSIEKLASIINSIV